MLYKLAKIENIRLIGVNIGEKEVLIELAIPQIIEGTQEHIRNRIIKEIAKIIDKEIPYRYSMKTEGAFISINIPIPQKNSFTD